MKLCICNKSKQKTKNTEIIVGLVVYSLLFASTEYVKPGIWPYLLLLITVLYVVEFINSLIHKHSFVCSLRKSFFDTVLFFPNLFIVGWP